MLPNEFELDCCRLQSRLRFKVVIMVIKTRPDAEEMQIGNLESNNPCGYTGRGSQDQLTQSSIRQR